MFAECLDICTRPEQVLWGGDRRVIPRAVTNVAKCLSSLDLTMAFLIMNSEQHCKSLLIRMPVKYCKYNCDDNRQIQLF